MSDMDDKPVNDEPQTEGDNYDDEPDESFGERILGLTEMFPESVRNVVGAVSSATVKSCRGLYQFSCSASWIFFTSSVILFAPVIFETERAQMEELHKSQQKQVLLGPGSAMAPSGPSPSLPLIR
ncbi:mitochondrial import receptor subunit TOM22 homolog isoform X2 [Drosophila sulfurigaster albostrigata]|uniref:Mitochondrial import receptor subunit TOM22 homolog n=1 Tax=Drosophila albomicans TaxID=7291 RepID=A0A6P8X265_DROAB|nr:mitochondrial import receptor subunit TOM22 homolog isoform X2 [Drosophila albomicans]XP_060654785.1 mitochondrial import receptor subunit TOM22 homolog isoform X2 [Drosophila nasuta]XP_062134479.1 mitochondrial import receptor subunit TOM22 homolog isoform X2 [Drosophila sulfurigaster albostrigata]